MLSFLNPCELDEVLEKESRLVMIACLRKSSFCTQRDVLDYVSRIYRKKLKICLLDADYLRLVEEKFDIHGIPAFILCFQGKKKEVFLGHTQAEDMEAFVRRNLGILKNM